MDPQSFSQFYFQQSSNNMRPNYSDPYYYQQPPQYTWSYPPYPFYYQPSQIIKASKKPGYRKGARLICEGETEVNVWAIIVVSFAGVCALTIFTLGLVFVFNNLFQSSKCIKVNYQQGSVETIYCGGSAPITIGPSTPIITPPKPPIVIPPSVRPTLTPDPETPSPSVKVPISLLPLFQKGQMTYTDLNPVSDRANCFRFTRDDNGEWLNKVLEFCQYLDASLPQYPSISMPEPTKLQFTGGGVVNFEIWENYTDVATYKIANAANSPEGLAIFVTGKGALLTVNGSRFAVENLGGPDWLQFPLPPGFKGHYSISLQLSESELGKAFVWLGEVRDKEKNTVAVPSN